MKYIIFLLKTLLWVFYVILTMNERNKYLAGSSRGYKCTDISGNGFTDTYTYDRTKKPTRDYLTWKEFRKEHKF